ncbi:DUF1636 family protein [Neotabrizicola shimadae]|uniref:DUF1636 domain-containing protein n=1 Tax=Neotabrizicola shimadae TaxID=2807096 RepID=A0A8G0ZZT8_9RHOB|nr:DUF1636 domain-containing protein [Neotabrizicola shimadae]QYZ71454.1 DUF1636 domain-containing protein [Neotabrizicola shimadae]
MAVLSVCITCKAGTAVAEGEPCPGARLHAALQPGVPGVRVVAVECLSVCDQGCSVALSGAGRWTYVYGRMSEADAPAILEGAAKYAGSADGLVPWRERPEIFRKRVVARVPPISQEAAE